MRWRICTDGHIHHKAQPQPDVVIEVGDTQANLSPYCRPEYPIVFQFFIYKSVGEWRWKEVEHRKGFDSIVEAKQAAEKAYSRMWQ